MNISKIRLVDGTEVALKDSESRALVETKQKKLIAGEGVKIEGNVISATPSGKPIEVDELPVASEKTVGSIYKKGNKFYLGKKDGRLAYDCEYRDNPEDEPEYALLFIDKPFENLQIGDKIYWLGYDPSDIDVITEINDNEVVAVFEGDDYDYDYIKFLNRNESEDTVKYHYYEFDNDTEYNFRLSSSNPQCALIVVQLKVELPNFHINYPEGDCGGYTPIDCTGVVETDIRVDTPRGSGDTPILYIFDDSRSIKTLVRSGESWTYESDGGSSQITESTMDSFIGMNVYASFRDLNYSLSPAQKVEEFESWIEEGWVTKLGKVNSVSRVGYEINQ